MTIFSDLLTEVYSLTNRPDLVEETKSAIKSATIKAHQSDFYPKDLFEIGIQWSPVAYIQSLDYRSVVSRWRALKFLRKYDNTGMVAGDFFTPLTPEQVLDSYGVAKEDVCYLAGDFLEIRSSTQDQYMLLGAYVNPDVEENSYNSWIALDHKYAIIYEALSKIFKMIGYDEQAATLRNDVNEQYALLRASNIQVMGY